MARRNVPKITSKDVYEFPYVKPEEKTFWQRVKLEIWDGDRKALLGRSATNWGALLIFYTLFFSAIAAMFAICMFGMLATIDDDRPTYELASSIIGSNPGLGYRPYQNADEPSSLIWYDAKNDTNVKSWTSRLDKFLAPYIGRHEGSENRVVCSFDQPPPPGKVCDITTSDFGPCTGKNGYSYNQSSPCVFIKLNKIYNWVPDVYNDTLELDRIMSKKKDDKKDEPMDDILKNHIKSLPVKNRNMIWISCQGENPADKDKIGKISYYPFQGLPGYYYPYTNIKGYLSPLVAVHFERPALLFIEIISLSYAFAFLPKRSSLNCKDANNPNSDVALPFKTDTLINSPTNFK